LVEFRDSVSILRRIDRSLNVAPNFQWPNLSNLADGVLSSMAF